MVEYAWVFLIGISVTLAILYLIDRSKKHIH